jgi:hypothetical protein
MPLAADLFNLASAERQNALPTLFEFLDIKINLALVYVFPTNIGSTTTSLFRLLFLHLIFFQFHLLCRSHLLASFLVS